MTTKRCKIEDDEGENKSDDEDQWKPKKIKIEKGSPQSAAAKPCKRSSQPVTRRGRGRGRGRGRTTVAIKKEIIESEMKLQSNQTLVLKSQDVPVASTSKVQGVPTGNFNTTWNVEEVLSQQIRIPRRVSLNIIHLLDEENTIPFIARYRRELTDNMDADGLREAEQTLKELRMPLSNAERQRRFRAKKKQLGQYEEFKAKHREEVKTNLEKKKHKEKLLPKKEQLALQRKRRQDTKKRAAACRQRKKQQKPECNNIEIGRYYAVYFSRKYYIGHVTSVAEDDRLSVNFLHKSGDNYISPRRPDVEDGVEPNRIFDAPLTVGNHDPDNVKFMDISESDIQKRYESLRKLLQ